MFMNKSAVFGTIIFSLSLLSCVEAAPVGLDKMVAVVNSTVITQSELNKELSMLKKKMEISGISLPKASELRKQALDELIDVSLQMQLAKANNIQISEKELNEIIANIAKNNGVTIQELKESVVQREGVSYSDFREQIRRQVLMSKLHQQALGREIIVSDKEVEKVLRNPPKMSSEPVQYNVVDILLEIPDGASEDQVRNITSVAKQMMAEMKKGVAIDKVVEKGQTKLEDQEVQSNDLGWRKVDEMPELFAKNVAKMKLNQVVGPIKAPNGLHILKLLGINGNVQQTGKLTKDQAQEIVFHRKLMEKVKSWLKEQRSKSYIKIIN